MAQSCPFDVVVFLLRRWKIMRLLHPGFPGKPHNEMYSNSFFRAATLRSSKERPANVEAFLLHSSPVIKEVQWRFLLPTTNTCFCCRAGSVNSDVVFRNGVFKQNVSMRELLSDRPNRISLKRGSNLEVAPSKLFKPNADLVVVFRNFCIALYPNKDL